MAKLINGEGSGPQTPATKAAAINAPATKVPATEAPASENHSSDWFSSCASGGCGSKIGAADLAALVADLPRLHDPALIAGYDGAEDAGVYLVDSALAALVFPGASPLAARSLSPGSLSSCSPSASSPLARQPSSRSLSPSTPSPSAASQSLPSSGLGIVSTADFFPPMVDDPKLFGMAAAANALSDVYAMGGRPLMVLNLVCFPQGLPKETLGLVLLGGAEKVMEAGAVVAGGHSIYDHEPKYGLAVTGLVDPGRMWRNRGARPGDAIILTKALGVGLILGARRVGMVSQSEFEGAAASITRLNRYAAEALKDFSVTAATDVTGFGLAGHLAEMAGCELTAEIAYDFLPILAGAERCAEEFLATGGGQRNRVQLSGLVDLGDLPAARQELVFDPQTSGGLAVCLPPEEAEEALAAIRETDPAAAIVGRMERRTGVISVAVF